FEDGLIGHKVGETVDLNLTFPEDYGAEELAGADVVFNVTINGIYE
ncbi:MAG: FKBP-type peptidyl-prolyl cis-trans isomerase, partial [Lachnospiraceae bacterium]|nr:FKBP-type peptidyl-prolyl cis-trans isomerase [Lachnospiraceae bacterium]